MNKRVCKDDQNKTYHGMSPKVDFPIINGVNRMAFILVHFIIG